MSPSVQNSPKTLSHSDKSSKSHMSLLFFEHTGMFLPQGFEWAETSPWMLFSQISIWLNVLLLQVFAEISPFKMRPFKLPCHSSSALPISSFVWAPLQYLPPFLYSIIYWVLYLLLVFSLFSLEHKLSPMAGFLPCFVLMYLGDLEQA